MNERRQGTIQACKSSKLAALTNHHWAPLTNTCRRRDMFRMKLKWRTNNGRRGRGGKGPWAKQTPPIFHPPWGIHRWLVHLVLACPVLLGFPAWVWVRAKGAAPSFGRNSTSTSSTSRTTSMSFCVSSWTRRPSLIRMMNFKKKLRVT